MGIFHWLLVLFLTIPLAEIAVLIQVGGVIGLWPTIALCVGTAVLGAALIRAQGLSTLARAQAELERGQVPAVTLLEGVFLLIAGALLLTPGLITDAVGFACLYPPLRRALILRFLERRGVLRRPGPRDGGGGPDGEGGPRVIEGEYRREDD